jgi:aryl-phospho-beta-D-glucosidase BglC (GH1 family)
MKYKNMSHLGLRGDEIEENSNGMADQGVVDEDSYSKDAPNLVQIGGQKWGEVAYEDTPQAFFHDMWLNSHEQDYTSDSPEGYHPDTLDTANLQLEPIGVKLAKIRERLM